MEKVKKMSKKVASSSTKQFSEEEEAHSSHQYWNASPDLDGENVLNKTEQLAKSSGPHDHRRIISSRVAEAACSAVRDNFFMDNTLDDNSNSAGSVTNNKTSPTKTRKSVRLQSKKKTKSKRKANDDEDYQGGTSSKTKRNNKTYECPVAGCDRIMKDWAWYRNHLEIHETLKPFVCPECSFGYEDELKLMQHVILRHEGTQSFECSECSMTYKSKWRLDKHMVKFH